MTNINSNGRSEDFDFEVPLEKLETNFGIMDTFGRMECPACGYEALTPMDGQCPNCHINLGENRAPIDKDGSMKLAGGVTAKEAMREAQKWWGKARWYFVRARERKGDPIRLTPSMRNARGVLMGLPWDELKRREKFEVVKAWHQAWLEANVIDPETGEPA